MKNSDEANLKSATDPHLRILPSSLDWLTSFRDCIDGVAREKKYLLMTEAPPEAKLQAFISGMAKKKNPQFLAVKDEVVIGWSDVRRLDEDPLIGELGMGVKNAYRGQGIGQRLLQTCVKAAWDLGFDKIQLKVYQNNQRAIDFYLAQGFREEMRLQSFAKLDGVWQDALQMFLHR